MPTTYRYEIFQSKTKRSFPKLVKKGVKGKKNAIETAKKYRESHPDRYVGIYTLNKVRTYKPKKG